MALADDSFGAAEFLSHGQNGLLTFLSSMMCVCACKCQAPFTLPSAHVHMNVTVGLCLYPAAQRRGKQKNETEDVFSVGQSPFKGNKGTIIETELFDCCYNHFPKVFVWKFSRLLSSGLINTGLIMRERAVLVHVTLCKSPSFPCQWRQVQLFGRRVNCKRSEKLFSSVRLVLKARGSIPSQPRGCYSPPPHSGSQLNGSQLSDSLP